MVSIFQVPDFGLFFKTGFFRSPISGLKASFRGPELIVLSDGGGAHFLAVYSRCVPRSLNVYPLKVASTPSLDILQVPCFYVISPSFREDSDYAKYIWTETGVVLTPRTV